MGTKEDKLMLIEWLTKLDDKASIERIKGLKNELDDERVSFFIEYRSQQLETSSNSLQNIVREEVVVYTRIKDGIKVWRY